jgi:trans-aconitate methyltransferase
MPDWDAERYHRVSEPQRAWGVLVIDRLAPAAGECILDIGCGTGRLTAEILARVPAVRVTGVDRSLAMLSEATRRFGTFPVLQADAVRLPFASCFDAVFSTATFHWVPNHTALFAEIHRVLAPGGRLVAQAGGGPNLTTLYGRAASLARAEFAPAFVDWQDPWTFAGVDETRARLSAAGFADVHVWLEEAPATFQDAREFSTFISTVCLRHHLARLPPSDRQRFVAHLAAHAATDEVPFTLDYWRLNVDARKN